MEFEGPTSIRIQVGDDDNRGVQDIELPAGARVDFDDDGTLVTEGTNGRGCRVEALGLHQPGQRLRRPLPPVSGSSCSPARPWSGAATAAGTSSGGWSSVLPSWPWRHGAVLFSPVLLGAEADTGWKRSVVDLATSLEGYGLEVTLLVIVGSSIVLALAADLVFSRLGRRASRRVRATWQSGTERLRSAIGADP